MNKDIAALQVANWYAFAFQISKADIQLTCATQLEAYLNATASTRTAEDQRFFRYVLTVLNVCSHIALPNLSHTFDDATETYTLTRSPKCTAAEMKQQMRALSMFVAARDNGDGITITDEQEAISREFKEEASSFLHVTNAYGNAPRDFARGEKMEREAGLDLTRYEDFTMDKYADRGAPSKSGRVYEPITSTPE